MSPAELRRAVLVLNSYTRWSYGELMEMAVEELQQWRIKKMKTLWGSCNCQARRLWLNLELAKKPPECLEYILVHEMVHLLERHHNERFVKLMDNVMPDWRLRKDKLNQAPLGHQQWGY